METFTFVLPFLTLALGYILGNLDRYLERRRKRKNLKTIFLSELTHNYEIIQHIPTDPPWALAEHIQEISRLSTTVYDAYLDRIDILSPRELNETLPAYLMTKRTIEFADDIQSIRGKFDELSNEDQFVEVGRSITHLAHSTSDAIRVLGGKT